MDANIVLGAVVAIWLAGCAACRFISRGPRSRLTAHDWDPKRGWLGPIALACFGLLYGGGWVLFGPHQSFRLGGTLALLGGAALLAVIVQYIRRPVLPTTAADREPASPADALLPPFHVAARGYDQAAVDHFFSGIWTMPTEQIEAAHFPVHMRGYRMQDVDRALEGWRGRRRDERSATPRTFQ